MSLLSLFQCNPDSIKMLCIDMKLQFGFFLQNKRKDIYYEKCYLKKLIK